MSCRYTAWRPKGRRIIFLPGTRPKTKCCIVLLACLICLRLPAEPLRILLAGTHDIAHSNPEGSAVSLPYNGAAAIRLDGDPRFLRGIQLDLTAPQNYLNHRGSLAVLFYSELSHIPASGAADVEARQIALELLPDKILNTWQIPLRPGHGLRSSPYITIPTSILPPASFPLLFRLIPAGKGIPSDLERMVFELQVRPLIGEEGALRLNFSYPENLRGNPIIVLIDDVLVESPEEERLLTQGEHNLVVLSEHYRSLSRRFVVERARTLELTVELQDPTPLLIFEYPEDARIFVNNTPVTNPGMPFPVEPGFYEVRFQISDYSIIRPVMVQRGKTYTIALSVDVDITEND